MSGTTRLTALRYAMLATGAIFVFGIYPLTQVWPSGWSWGVGHSHYIAMILGVYATLGVSLVFASRDPLASRSLIWFTAASSLVHSAIMAVQALADPAERGHLVGDVPALLLIGAVFVALAPKSADAVAIAGRGIRRAA